MENIPTALQLVDSGEKSRLSPVLFHAYDNATGVKFYPPLDSDHAKLMDLVTYNAALTPYCSVVCKSTILTAITSSLMYNHLVD